jgi:hypothetical protein
MHSLLLGQQVTSHFPSPFFLYDGLHTHLFLYYTLIMTPLPPTATIIDFVRSMLTTIDMLSTQSTTSTAEPFYLRRLPSGLACGHAPAGIALRRL